MPAAYNHTKHTRALTCGLQSYKTYSCTDPQLTITKHTRAFTCGLQSYKAYLCIDLLTYSLQSYKTYSLTLWLAFINGLDDIFCTMLGRRSRSGSPMMPAVGPKIQMKPRNLTPIKKLGTNPPLKRPSTSLSNEEAASRQTGCELRK